MLGTQALAAISFTFPVTLSSPPDHGAGAGLCALLGHALGQGRHDEAARITTDCLSRRHPGESARRTGGMTITPLFTLLGPAPSSSPSSTITCSSGI